jgi:phenylpyruvate tautomerase PptA (4-oxalocrotonate tautomerase family)
MNKMQRVTDAIVSVEGEALRQGVQVIIEESVNSGEWNVGGKMLTIEALEKMKAGQNPWD